MEYAIVSPSAFDPGLAVVGDGPHLTHVAAALRGHAIAAAAVPGAARVRPADRIGHDGWRVVRRDGSETTHAAVVLVPAVGAATPLPWLDPDLADWEDGRPLLVGGTLAPGLCGLYVCAPASIAEQAGIVAAVWGVQRALDHPAADDLAPSVRAEPLQHDGSPAPRQLRRLSRRVRGWTTAEPKLEPVARPLPVAALA